MMTYLSEEFNSPQLALSLPLADKLTLAKSLKQAMLKAPKEERPNIKKKIRALFTDEEWKKLQEDKANGRNSQ